MTNIFIPLNIPNIEVINIQNLEDHSIVIHVQTTEIGTHCKHCGKFIVKVHGLNKTIILNHLPVFGNPVYIKYQSVRYQCLECEGHPTTTQNVSWYQIAGQCTEQYAINIIKSLINSTIMDV